MVLRSIGKISSGLLLMAITLVACDDRGRYDYDNGYESAWNEDKAPTWFSSKDYEEGYEQGLQDAYMYDEGYYDGYNKNRCRYPKGADYMDGYKDGYNKK